MSELPATVAQLRAIGRSTTDRVLLVQAAPVWTSEPVLHVGARTATVVAAPTVLAVRDALAHHRDDELLIVLTDRSANELGLDVMARVSRQQVRRLDPAELIRSELGLRGNLDPKLAQIEHRWLLQALLAMRPSEGWAKPPSGLLQYDDAARQVLERGVGIAAEPSLADVLDWARSPGAIDRLRAAGTEVHAGVAALLGARVGAVTALLLNLADAGRADDLLAAGLVAGVLWPSDDAADLIAARVRFELELGVQPTADDAAAWASAAEAAVVRQLHADGRATVDATLQRAERLATSIGAGALTASSNVLPSGLDLRFEAFGRSLDELLAQPSTPSLAEVEARAAAVRSHALAAADAQRLATMQAAVRLARRLAHPQPAPVPTLPALAAAYAGDGAWVDRARLRVRRGDRSPAVAAAYGRLLSAVDAEREAANRQFAGQLVEWSRGEPPVSPGLLPLEHLLDRVVAPLAGEVPVLLIVADGTSWPVALDVVDDARQQGWVRLQQAHDVPIGVALLPTVTESSRTSLLTGRRVAGHAAEEQAGFSTHPALRALPGPAPRLFHKATLTTAGGEALAPDLRGALVDPAQRVVGVVINAVDDHLSRGQQIRVEWTTDAMGPLRELLVEAAAAGRTVILTSDHGHVLDEGRITQLGVAETGERWRPADRPPIDGEVSIAGPRVLLGGGKVVFPASELLRYGPPKHGYHGGATPQEVLVPIVVLARATAIPDGWGPRTDDTPRWWTGGEPEPPLPIPPAHTDAPAAPVSETQQPGLFDEPAPAVAVAPDWIAALLASQVFESRRPMLQRSRIDDDRVARALAALDARGGTSIKSTLAADIDVVPFRLDGFVHALAAALNVDGYAVLEMQGDSVTLNRALLLTQFGLAP